MLSGAVLLKDVAIKLGDLLAGTMSFARVPPSTRLKDFRWGAAWIVRVGKPAGLDAESCSPI